MLKHSVITKSYLENVRHLLSSSHLKMETETQKIHFKQTNNLPPIYQSKDLFMLQLIRHQKSTNSLIDKNHSKSAQLLIDNQHQSLTNNKPIASEFSSPKKGKIIFNTRQPRKLQRQCFVLNFSNERSKEKANKMGGKSIKKIKLVDRKQIANGKQIQKSSLYPQDPRKYLSGLMASSKKKKQQSLKSKEKSCKTEVIEIKNIHEKALIIKSENVSSRSKYPEHLQLKRILHPYLVTDHFEKYKSNTQHCSQKVTKEKRAHKQRTTLNKACQHGQEQMKKQSKYFQPWSSLYPSQSQLFTPFGP